MWTADQAISHIALRRALKGNAWPSEMGAKFESAGEQLAKHIANGQIRAKGRQVEEGLFHQHSPFEQIPAGDFHYPGFVFIVSPEGSLATLPRHRLHAYRGRKWDNIEVDEADVIKIWPEPPPINVVDWMTSEAKRVKEETGHPGKHDDLVKRCMSATRCTKRVAIAVHKELPPEYRRRRGKPTKSDG